MRISPLQCDSQAQFSRLAIPGSTSSVRRFGVTIDTGLDSVPIEILPELVESVVEIS